VSLLQTESSDIDLVVVDGLPVYGTKALLGQFVRSEAIDDLDDAGYGLVMVGDPRLVPKGEQHLPEIRRLLTQGIGPLAPLRER
jgi:hypothetical protein